MDWRNMQTAFEHGVDTFSDLIFQTISCKLTKQIRKMNMNGMLMELEGEFPIMLKWLFAKPFFCKRLLQHIALESVPAAWVKALPEHKSIIGAFGNC